MQGKVRIILLKFILFFSIFRLKFQNYQVQLITKNNVAYELKKK